MFARAHTDTRPHRETYFAGKDSANKLKQQLKKCGPGFDKALLCLEAFAKREFKLFDEYKPFQPQGIWVSTNGIHRVSVNKFCV
jgi:hypothetical protein